MQLNYVQSTLYSGWNSAATTFWRVSLACDPRPRRAREPHRQREPQHHADRQRGEGGLRGLLETHAMAVDDDEAQRLGGHAAAHALGDQAIASAQTEARARDGNYGPVSVNDRRTEHGRGVRFLADDFGKFRKRRRKVLLQSFRFGIRQSPHRSISSAG